MAAHPPRFGRIDHRTTMRDLRVRAWPAGRHDPKAVQRLSRLLEAFAKDAIIDRHEANSQLFNAFFDKPGFAQALLDYLAGAYDELRAAQAR